MDDELITPKFNGLNFKVNLKVVVLIILIKIIIIIIRLKTIVSY